MIDMPFENKNQVLKKYDDLMVEVGNHLLKAESLLNSFIMEIIRSNDNELNIEIELTEHADHFLNIRVKSINWNDERRCLEIHAVNGKNMIILDWDNLPISTKNLIVNFVHLNLLSDEIYNNFN